MVAQRRAPILVVDDDPMLRELLQTFLDTEGLPVATACDRYTALLAAASQRPALVVLDLGLRQSSGEELGTILREWYGPALPIVVISARERLAEAATLLGALAALPKPFELDTLLALVQRAVEPAES